LRKDRPTLSDVPTGAPIDPKTERHLRTFWGEVGSDAMYEVGSPQLEGSSCITPINLYVRRSASQLPEYLSSMNLSITFAEVGDIRQGRFVSSPPPKRGSGEMPSVTAALAAAREADRRLPAPLDASSEQGMELRFRFARLENVGAGPDAHGLFHKRLWVWGAVPIASALHLRDELRLVISCFQLHDLDRLFLRPVSPQAMNAR